MNYINTIIENLKSILNNFSRNKLLLMFGVFWLFIMLVAAYSVYDIYIKSKLSEHKLNKEFVNNDNNNDKESIKIIFFHTEWCPHCKRAKPEWKKFDTYVNGIKDTIDYKIYLDKVDGDVDTKQVEKYKVEGYPTIKLIYKDKIYDYDAKVTKDNLIEFLNTIK